MLPKYPKDLHFDLTAKRLKSSRARSQMYMDIILDKEVEESIVETAKSLARYFGRSQRFVNSIKWVRTGFLKGYVELDYFGPDGQPLGIFFEKGTKAHGPVTAPKLHWKDEETGEHIFADWVRGIVALRIMENAAKMGMPALKTRLITKTNKRMEEAKLL